MCRINYVVGDVREQRAIGDAIRVIPHCCNDINVMGAGVAKALYTKWYKVKGRYHHYFTMNEHCRLGSTQFIEVEPDTYVVNMIGQHGVGTDENGNPPVRYEALEKAMRSIVHFFDDINIEIHCPMFGCDLAGGDWKIVSRMINEIWCPVCPVTCCVIDTNKLATIG